MNREEAIKIISNYEINGCGYCHQGDEEIPQAFEVAIRSLEAWDKVIEDIESDWQLKEYPSQPFSCGLRQALEIINKYLGEVEK
jgi:hypothetical protein